MSVAKPRQPALPPASFVFVLKHKEPFSVFFLCVFFFRFFFFLSFVSFANSFSANSPWQQSIQITPRRLRSLFVYFFPLCQIGTGCVNGALRAQAHPARAPAGHGALHGVWIARPHPAVPPRARTGSPSHPVTSAWRGHHHHHYHHHHHHCLNLWRSK